MTAAETMGNRNLSAFSNTKLWRLFLVVRVKYCCALIITATARRGLVFRIHSKHLPRTKHRLIQIIAGLLLVRILGFSSAVDRTGDTVMN